LYESRLGRLNKPEIRSKIALIDPPKLVSLIIKNHESNKGEN